MVALSAPAAASSLSHMRTTCSGRLARARVRARVRARGRVRGRGSGRVGVGLG